MTAVTPPQHAAIEKLVSLLGICQRINSERNFDELLRIIAEEAAKIAGAERATIFLLDRERDELWAKVALGTSQMIRFDSRLGIAGAVTRTGKAMVIDDAYNSPHFYPAIDSMTGFHTRNVLCVPLRNYRGQILGVFQVLNKAVGRFLPEDEQFVDALASQAAIAIENARHVTDLEEQNQSLRREVEERFSIKSILGTSKKIEAIRTLIGRIALTPVSVLVTGENGTGKELAARAIHFSGPRAAKPFVALNCAALPDTLIESELFGIEKGVATGVERRIGKIESANNGTLFLDEVADLSLSAQAKLLRVLQEREVEWVGGRKPVRVDVCIIAATNKNLDAEIEDGGFRQDLYFRLKVIHLHMPPLREMRSDVPLLATHFLRRYAREMNRPIDGISLEAMNALTAYDWPGNVRELENEIKRAIVMASGDELGLEELSAVIRDGTAPLVSSPRATPGSEARTLKDQVTTLEIQMIQDVMTQTGGDKKRAARMLGLSLQGLLNKLKRYGL